MPERTATNKVFCVKACNFVEISKNDGYQRGLVAIVYRLFDKKSSGANTSISAVEDLRQWCLLKIRLNTFRWSKILQKQLAEEFYHLNIIIYSILIKYTHNLRQYFGC